jgi:gamma-glutamylcyclotransferase
MLYLAYGSNLHPLRMALRVPNSRLVKSVPLVGYRLTFHKRSTDGSSKCNLDFTDRPNDLAHGAIYEVPANEMHLLDSAEGLGCGYYKSHIEVAVDGSASPAFIYLASQSHLVTNLEPYEWYKKIVLAGAKHLRFPGAYIQQIEAVISKPDPDNERRLKWENLLVQLEG